MRINSVGMFLTRRCNFRCIYCNTDTGSDPSDKLSLDEAKDIVVQARALGARWLVIPGEGEPMLDKNLFPLIEFSLSQKLHTKVFTNGSLIDRRAADFFFRNRVSVVYKLHAADEQTYDVLAGKKNAAEWVEYRKPKEMQRTIRIPVGLRHLLEAGYGHGNDRYRLNPLFELATVIVRPNLNQIPLIARMAKDLDSGLFVETTIFTGRAVENADFLSVTVEEELHLYNNLSRILGWRFRAQQKVRCRFETNPFFDVNGRLRHCYGLDADIGCISESSLEDLHAKELSLRKKTDMISRIWNWGHRGFRKCATRRRLDCHDMAR